MPRLHEQPSHDADSPISATAMTTESDTIRLPELTLSHFTHIFSKLAFWSAITLPVVYLPLLMVGLDSMIDLLMFFSLFALHVLTLILGQTHLAD